LPRARILLADDHTIVSEGLRKLLESEFEVVGTVADGKALCNEATRLKPDAVLVDISMPVINGLDAARRIRRELPETKILFLTMRPDLSYLRDAMKLGASGYVLKRSAARELVIALRTVLRGKTYVAAELLETIKDPKLRNALQSGRVRALTERQREILRLIAVGKSNKEIADILSLKTGTVSFHRKAIARKLGVSSTAALTSYAMEHGLAAG
jgi:DNA-binding NarL/FixJ family response regulator